MTARDKLRQVPDYEIRQLVPHTIEGGQLERAHKLLLGSSIWMEEKYRRFSSDTSYIEDLKAVQDFYKNVHSNSVEMSELIVLWIAQQIVNQRTSSFTDTDLAVLVWLEKAAEARSHALLRVNALERYQGLHTIYEIQQQKKSPPIVFLKDLEEAAVLIDGSAERSSALLEIANKHLELNRFAQYQALIDQHEGSVWTPLDPLMEVRLLQKRGKHAEARTLLTSFTNRIDAAAEPMNQLMLMLAVANVWHELDDDEQALTLFQRGQKVCFQMTDPLDQIVGLLTLGKGMYGMGIHYEHEAHEIFKTLLHQLEEMKIDTLREMMTKLVIENLYNANYPELIPMFARRMQFKNLRGTALCMAAMGFSKRGQTEKAQEFIKEALSISGDLDEDDKKALNRWLTLAYAQMGDWKTVESLISTQGNDSQVQLTLAKLAFIAAQKGETGYAQTFWAKSRALSTNFIPDARTIETLCMLACYLLHHGAWSHHLLQLAQNLCQQIEAGDQLNKAVGYLVEALVRLGQLETCWELAETIKQAKPEILLAIAHHAASSNQLELFPRIEAQLGIGSYKAEFLRLWAATYIKNQLWDKAKQCLKELTGNNRYIQRILSNASIQMETPAGTGDLFRTLRLAEVETACKLAVAQFQAGKQTLSLQSLEHLMDDYRASEDDYITVCCDIALATAWKALGDLTRAKQCIEHALRIQASLVDTDQHDFSMYQLAQYYLADQQMDAAIQLLDSMGGGNSWKHETRLLIIRSQLPQGQLDNAIGMMEPIEDTLERSEASYLIALAYIEQDQPQKALSLHNPPVITSSINLVIQWLSWLAPQEFSFSDVKILNQVLKITGWIIPFW